MVHGGVVVALHHAVNAIKLPHALTRRLLRPMLAGKECFFLSSGNGNRYNYNSIFASAGKRVECAPPASAGCDT